MPNRGQQGTGKHGHKDTQEPFPHHEGKSSGDKSHGGEHKEMQHKAAGQKESGTHKSGDDLKSREYKDAKGNVHHHTRTSGKD
jgi:hypothetical protein